MQVTCYQLNNFRRDSYFGKLAWHKFMKQLKFIKYHKQ